MHKVTAYHCDYCKKVLANRTGMRRHEAKCLYNPASMSCGTCANIEVNQAEIRPGVYRKHYTCKLNRLSMTATPRNPDGLRTGCIRHIAKTNNRYED